jgi:phosphoglycolate phosphatase
MTTRLVLWDIDHTLIETRGIGGQVYAEAFAKVTGRPLEKMPELAGRTEPVIFRDALKVNGIETSDGLYAEFAAEQARGYLAHLDELCRGRDRQGHASRPSRRSRYGA